ncbi:MAG: cation-transporting P-type ATPase [Acidimicrobiia bacterium]
MTQQPAPTMAGGELPERPWALPAHQVAEQLGTDVASGLTAEQVEQRRARFGRNQLTETEPISVWRILVNQFKSVIVGLLALATIVSVVLGDYPEAMAVGVVIVINTVIGFATEIRAMRSMESLRDLASVTANVLRDGDLRAVPAEDLVPGDVVVFEGGDVIAADLRLLDGSKVEADESALTGESAPVSKRPEPLATETVLGDRANLLHKGTAITRGAGQGIVFATGIRTELGRISELVEQATQPETPLQRQLQELGRRLLWITLGVAALIGVIGGLSGRTTRETVETAIALAVAAIPEGLPIVATVALARGMRRMARRNVLIEKLSAVETLGSVGVILTDKTGTLTENRMVLTRLVLAETTIEFTGGYRSRGELTQDGVSVERLPPDVERSLMIASLCNNSSLGDDDENPVGDPTEVALLMGAAKAGIHRAHLLAELPEEREIAFDADLRMMATIHRRDGGFLVAVKGAPDSVLVACDRLAVGEEDRELNDDDRSEWLKVNDQLADEGLRVLALATRSVDDAGVDPYGQLVFLGLAALIDPPRDDVREAIEDCMQAGIDIVMITGDQPATASYIADALGLDGGHDRLVTGRELAAGSIDSVRMLDARVFARTSPEQKLDVIAARQAAGDSVAMIGDGVNDAPALKKADIGVAMGIRGTQVAKEASDVVVQDDRFGSIVHAVKEGRVIFDNIRKFVLYLLSSNLSEIIVVGVGAMLALPLPLLPLQILYLNLITDVFPALALGAGQGEPGVMDRPPRRPDEGVLARRHWYAIGSFGFMMSVPVLGVLAYAVLGLGVSNQVATTMSFLTLAFAQLWHVFNMASPESPILHNDVTGNGWVWGAIALSAGLLLLAVYVPVLSGVMNVATLDPRQWLIVLGASLTPLVLGQALRPLRRRYF